MNPSHSPQTQLALDKEKERYLKALEKLHDEQDAKLGMMLDDREQDLLAEHYRRVAEILQT